MHLWTESKVCFPENRLCSCSLRTQEEDTKIALLPGLLPHRWEQQGERKEGRDLWAGRVMVGQQLSLGGASLDPNDKHCHCSSPDIGSPWTGLEGAAFYKINI